MVDAKRKAFIFLLLAFILAVIAGGLIINQLQAIAESSGETETIQVAAAAQDIKSYETLESEDIEWIEIPATEQSGNFIHNESDLEDTMIVVDMDEGNYITENIVRTTRSLPPDQRIVSLNITDNVILDQMVAEGDKVDIIVVYQQDGNTSSERLFEGVSVVQVETGIEDSEDEEKSTVKVSLTVEEAQELIYYQNVADQIRVLRINGNGENPGDAEKG